MLSLEFLTARVIKLPTSTPISVLILKPLWLLFAVSTYLSRTCLRYALIAFDFAGNVSISSASRFNMSLRKRGRSNDEHIAAFRNQRILYSSYRSFTFLSYMSVHLTRLTKTSIKFMADRVRR